MGRGRCIVPQRPRGWGTRRSRASSTPKSRLRRRTVGGCPSGSSPRPERRNKGRGPGWAGPGRAEGRGALPPAAHGPGAARREFQELQRPESPRAGSQEPGVGQGAPRPTQLPRRAQSRSRPRSRPWSLPRRCRCWPCRAVPGRASARRAAVGPGRRVEPPAMATKARGARLGLGPGGRSGTPGGSGRPRPGRPRTPNPWRTEET